MHSYLSFVGHGRAWLGQAAETPKPRQQPRLTYAYVGMRSAALFPTYIWRAHSFAKANTRANGAERRSGRQPGARVLIPPGYLHPGKGKH
jgi:hypothetical protein